MRKTKSCNGLPIVWLVLLCCFLPWKLAAQDQPFINGTVTDSLSGDPLPGVTVMIKSTTKGTVTNNQGQFKLPADHAAVLVFSSVGYVRKEMPAGSGSLSVMLTPNNATLKDVVVVGYGTMEKRELTSSITSLKSKDIIPGMMANPLMAVQGKVTGLNTVSSNGTDPNASVSVQLRGANSVKASMGPLIVIDGVPGGDINTVAREDIQSIDVLKDASAAAIYGTRASGGVVLITTKSAKAGAVSLSYSGELSTETVRRRAEVLSPEEFVAAGLGEDLGHKTDWFKTITRSTPISQRHVVNISGGSESAKVYATLFSRNSEGIAIGANKKEIGGRLNVHFKTLDDKLEIIGHSSYSSVDADVTNIYDRDNNNNSGIFNMALKLNPTQTPYDPEDVTGYNVWTGGYDYWNPLADVKLRSNKTQYKYMLADVTLKLNLTKDLFTSVMVATNNSTEQPISWRSAQHKTSRETGVYGYAKQEYKKWWDKTLEWLVSYNKQFGQHSIKAVAGYSFQEFNGQGFWAENQDFPIDGLKENDMGSGNFLSDGRAGLGSWRNSRERLIAFFGRANYSYKDRYLLSASARQEGSSKFAPAKRWGTFPAISAGWRISAEPFMRPVTFVNELKLRAGYGITGNAGFDPGTAMRMYGRDTWWLVDGRWVSTYGLAHNQNVNLEWEKKKEINIGVDFSLFDNRLSGKVDVYQRTSDDMIYDISVSQPPAIHDKTTMNVGSLRNRGIEAELTWNAIQRNNWSYSSTLRGAHNKNTLVTLWGSQTWWDRKSFPAPGSPGSAVRLAPGEDIGQFYLWKSAGFSKEGNWLLYDKDGKVFDVSQQSKSLQDKRFVGNAIPKVILSWDHAFSYKNFDLNLYMRGWFGYDVFNMINMYYSLPNVKEQNVLKSAFEEHKNIKGEKELTDYWLEKGNFVKIDVITLGYRFDTERLKYIKNLRLYLSGRDLFTITRYSGLDPEVDINGLEPGFEGLNVYPKTRSFTFGVQANF
ncbi:SusC/RagA family TonB-linked outer membrane protein [Chitinophaga sp. MM2321]|uniref:SusC/RagA family TonB-linked outer membrane protein n=1 Tax=Chitinophaga sp. MM2321 TaxID=3137178 RepID=UPI0032D57231